MAIVNLPQAVQVNGRSFSRAEIVNASAIVPTIVANVLGASNTTPIIATFAGNGVGPAFGAAMVTIAGVLGNLGANGSWYAIASQYIYSASAATPIALGTGEPHGLVSGLSVIVIGSSNANANGTFVVTVTSPTTFTLNGSGGGAVGVGGSWSPVGGGYLLVGSSGSGAYTSGGTVTMPVASSTGQRAGLIPDSTQ
jgi:hypothetical protein